MKKIVIKVNIIFFIVLFSYKAYSQQDAQYTQYMFNTLSVNSAYAGTKDALNIILLNRNQWVGFEGAPVTQSLTIHTPIKKEMLGLGFSYIRDKIGPLTTDNLYIDIAYRLKVHEGGFLSMGLKGGFDIRKNNMTGLNPLDASDPAYAKDLVSDLKPNFGAGLFYYTDKYYFGFSTPKISKQNLSNTNDPNLGTETISRHYFLIAGYVWDLNEDWKFKPTSFVKLVKGAPASFDLSASFMYHEKFIGGLTHRFGDSFGAMVELRVLRQLWLGYAYDYSISELQKYNSGTHEIMLNLDLNLLRKDIVKSPRFF